MKITKNVLMKKTEIYKFFKTNITKIYFYSLIPPLFYILIYNILYYDPILGYDAEAHYSYVDSFSRYLPRRFRIPLSSETREFFNPPMAYVFPSAIQVMCRNFYSADNLLESCKPIYGNLTQIFQTIMYLFSIYINLLSLKIISAKKFEFYSISYLLLTMLLAVNYRTISMIRGEPYILFFLSLLIYEFVKLENNNFKFKNLDILKLGLIIGCLALSRQWSFLLFPAFFLVIIKIELSSSLNYLKSISKSFFIGFLISGWFYIYNFFQYGSFIAFNIKKNEINYFDEFNKIFSIENITNNLFVNPIRPIFDNQLIPILYSDTWGDYWGYFVFTSRFLDVGIDQILIGQLLGRVNLVSTFTSILLIIGFFYRSNLNKNPVTISLLKYFILFSLVGFIWFVINYPTSSGDTIKATYIVQLLNLLAMLGAIFIDNIKNNKIYFGIIMALTIVFIHNFSSFLSKFPIGYPN